MHFDRSSHLCLRALRNINDGDKRYARHKQAHPDEYAGCFEF